MHGESESKSDLTGDAGEKAAKSEGGEAMEGSPTVGTPSTRPPPPETLEQALAELARMKENWLRTAADFDNFRKRSRREIEDARRGGREDLLRVMFS